MMDRMTQQNSALVEQVAAAAKSMERRAFELEQVVATFSFYETMDMVCPAQVEQAVRLEDDADLESIGNTQPVRNRKEILRLRG